MTAAKLARPAEVPSVTNCWPALAACGCPTLVTAGAHVTANIIQCHSDEQIAGSLLSHLAAKNVYELSQFDQIERLHQDGLGHAGKPKIDSLGVIRLITVMIRNDHATVRPAILFLR
jgi:hypothetical protein